MKKIKLLILIPLLLAAISCTQSTLEEPSSSKIKRVSDDVLLKQFVSKLSELTDFAKKEKINAQEFIDDFSKIQSEADLENKIFKYYKNPESVLEAIDELNAISKQFQETNEEFLTLNGSEQRLAISNSVDNFIMESLNAKEAPSGGTDQCADQLAADKKACKYGAIVGGAGCGLLTPTIIGAIGCYAAVMAADIVCHTAAEDSYDICKKYSKPTA